MSPLEWLVAFLLGSLVVAIVALAAHAARSALEVGIVAVVGLAVAFVLFVPDENGVSRVLHRAEAASGSPTATETVTATPTVTLSPTVTLTPTATPTATPTEVPMDTAKASPVVAATPSVSCESKNLVANPGFETEENWTQSEGGCHPIHSTFMVDQGARSMLLGIPLASPDANCDSFIVQEIAIPADVSTGTVSFRYWPACNGHCGNDRQEAMLIDEKGQTLVTLMEVQENAWTWQEYHKDLNLSPHAGQTINLRFNVHNDGVGGHRSFMYVDNVTLRVCQ